MAKLTKEETIKRDELISDLTSQQQIIQALSEESPRNTEDLLKAIAMMNVILEEAETFREEILSRVQGEFDDKSDKWQQSDNGYSTLDFISDWENVAFDELPFEVETFNFDDLIDYAQMLEDLPTEME